MGAPERARRLEGRASSATRASRRSRSTAQARLEGGELEGLTFGFGWLVLASLVGDCVWAPELGADRVDGLACGSSLLVGVAEMVVHGDSLLRGGTWRTAVFVAGSRPRSTASATRSRRSLTAPPTPSPAAPKPAHPNCHRRRTPRRDRSAVMHARTMRTVGPLGYSAGVAGRGVSERQSGGVASAALERSCEHVELVDRIASDLERADRLRAPLPGETRLGRGALNGRDDRLDSLPKASACGSSRNP